MKDFVREDILVSRLADGGASTHPMPIASTAPALAGPIAVPEAVDQGTYRQWGKRVLDIALVLISLPVTIPVILLSAVALWVESGLPFYTQDRLGRNGKRFRILKLRTMVRDADAQFERLMQTDAALRAEWNATQKLQNDPRVTRVGAFLRVTSLDELPQIWNILTGEMTLVGPRPMMPQQLSLYGDPRAYFAMRPGLTGAWQVSTRNQSEFQARWSFDAQYHAYHNLREDLRIIWRTVGVVLKRTGY